MALRFVPTGDIEAAGRLKGVGWRLLYDLKRRMSFQKLFQDRTVLKTEDGTIIECLVCGALDTINIFVPIPIEVEDVIKEIKHEGSKYRIYCVMIKHEHPLWLNTGSSSGIDYEGWWPFVVEGHGEAPYSKGVGDWGEYIPPTDLYDRKYIKVDKAGKVTEITKKKEKLLTNIIDGQEKFVAEFSEEELKGFVDRTPLTEYTARPRCYTQQTSRDISAGQRVIKNEYENALPSVLEEQKCKDMQTVEGWLYTAMLPEADWYYLLQLPNGETLSIMGYRYGVIIWTEKEKFEVSFKRLKATNYILQDVQYGFFPAVQI